MKSVLLVAPGVAPPLTEGRKLYVTDLAATLRSRGLQVTVLSGSPDVSGLLAIFQVLGELRESCRLRPAFDAAAIFPWGTFLGARRWGNSWLLRRATRMCSRAGIPSLPVFYSCFGLEMDDLGRRFGPAVAMGRSGPDVRSIPLGVRRHLPPWQSRSAALDDVLFLCGYQQPTRRSLHDVLETRGLIDLLRAGNALAAAGIRLSIAIPFLRHGTMRMRLLAYARRLCPSLGVSLHGEVDAARIFQNHDAFVFPYRAEHAVFVPTSLLEALSVGIPVVAADHVMYRAMTTDATGPRCGLYQPGNVDGLVGQILELRDHYAVSVDRAVRAAFRVHEEWTIERSADELLAAFSRLSP